MNHEDAHRPPGAPSYRQLWNPDFHSESQRALAGKQITIGRVNITPPGTVAVIFLRETEERIAFDDDVSAN